MSYLNTVTIPEGNPEEFWYRNIDGIKLHCFVIDGVAKHLQAWCDDYGISKYVFIYRRKHHPEWTVERCFSTPVNHFKHPRKRINAIRQEVFGIEGEEGSGQFTTPTRSEASKRRIRENQEEAYVTELIPEASADLRNAAREKVRRLRPEEELLILERDFGERKYQACLRLKDVGLYVAFRKRVMFFRNKTRTRFSRHVAFYLALQEFPKPKT